ncbi:response regulator transcription factor [Humibacillus xanthopallidus]|uniref:response regulator transcription factor n=1 Tax=Humibacillus xanthopallidus TaxID=412689 RepID=UPI00384FCCDC
MATVLVVDDDPIVREVLSSYLLRAGLEVAEAGDGEAALRAFEAGHPDLVVLDLTLPRLDGLEVFRRMRAVRGDLPVVMLTARGEESDRVLGLEVGADDYITKPFSNRELVLRVQSILRRVAVPSTTPPSAGADAAPAASVSEALVDGDLRVDRRRHEVWLGETPLALTVREYDLLVHLMATPGTAHSRRALMTDVWGWDYGDEATVTVHVRRLREKVERDPSQPERITTVWGVGYRWDGAS